MRLLFGRRHEALRDRWGQITTVEDALHIAHVPEGLEAPRCDAPTPSRFRVVAEDTLGRRDVEGAHVVGGHSGEGPDRWQKR